MYGIENLALPAQQKALLVDALRALGRNADPAPCRRNHWRVRLDEEAVIWHAAWDVSDWTIATMKARLAAIFGVAVGTITASTQSTQYGPVVTFGRSGTNYLRAIVFGGVDCTWEQSHAAALAYLRDYAEQWEESY